MDSFSSCQYPLSFTLILPITIPATKATMLTMAKRIKSSILLISMHKINHHASLYYQGCDSTYNNSCNHTPFTFMSKSRTHKTFRPRNQQDNLLLLYHPQRNAVKSYLQHVAFRVQKSLFYVSRTGKD